MRQEKDHLEQLVRRRREEISKRKTEIQNVDYEKSKLKIEVQRDTIKLQEQNMVLDQLNTEYARMMGCPLPPKLDILGPTTSSKTVIDNKYRPESETTTNSMLEPEVIEIPITSQSLGGDNALLQAGFGRKTEYPPTKVEIIDDSREDMPDTSHTMYEYSDEENNFTGTRSSRTGRPVRHKSSRLGGNSERSLQTNDFGQNSILTS